MSGTDGQSDVEGESISSVQSMILDLPPSCIEFCPAHPSYFVVGTYYLEKEEEAAQGNGDAQEQPAAEAGKPQSRNGSLIVFRLKDGNVHTIQTVSQPSAVFDLHFQPQADRGDICATVSSIGTISIFKLSPTADDQSPKVADADVLKPLSVLRIPDLGEDVLFTYFAWHPTVAGLMAVTTASGTVLLVRVHDDYQGLDVVEDAILKHSLEAWVVAFSPPPSPPEIPQHPLTTIFSGGDDSALKYTTFSPPSSDPHDEAQIPTPPVTLRDHTAGVTSILPLPLPLPVPVVLTGSYDDALRVFALAPARPAKLLAERNLGGGVWRLNMIGAPRVSPDGRWWEVSVLASCMHAGTRVLRVRGESSGDGGTARVDVLGRFEEHASMNYGSDWSRAESRLGSAEGEVVCVSTSFYDRLLCLWSFKLGPEVSD